MKAVGSDLNPVAVLITKALIEIPPKFANKPPVNPDADPMGMTVGKGRKSQKLPWRGAAGLAADIRYYGKWMREEAFKRIGHLYPTIKDEDGIDRTVIAWLWSRTIPCSNPACGINMPLMTTFQLSKKKGYEHWTMPSFHQSSNSISFKVQNNNYGISIDRTVDSRGVTCIRCNTFVPLSYVREQAQSGNMNKQMTGIVAAGDRKRIYLSPDYGHDMASQCPEPDWHPWQGITKTPTVSALNYGVSHWYELFSNRQLTALTTFSDMINEVHQHILNETSDREYADAVSTYLTFANSKSSSRNSKFNLWDNTKEIVTGMFGRQVIPIIWDFAEANPLSSSNGSLKVSVDGVARVLEKLTFSSNVAVALQTDATSAKHSGKGPVIITDPPYYDNIHYADLSDFFYVWHRHTLRDIYPDLYASILTPKSEEMIAAPRFDNAKERFEELMSNTLSLIREHCTDDYPSSIFYAYKQQEEERGGRTSTGWETMLNALITSGFQIVGTWPMRTELTVALKKSRNVLATSVVIVCRPRPEDAPIATRSQFLSKLKQELPDALDKLTGGARAHIDPVDMPQAAIGPGMGIYSQYSQVIRNNGKPVPVREALKEINNAVAAYFDAQQGSLDDETRLCFGWLTQHGFDKGRYGDVETLARASNLAMSTVNDMQHLMTAQGGTAQLNPIQYFNPKLKSSNRETTAWEGCMRMAWHFSQEDGNRIPGAAEVAANMLNGNTDNVETLARILYDHYDRKNQPGNALIYNTLVHNMPDIRQTAAEMQRANQAAII